jgi:transposase InsO family protein
LLLAKGSVEGQAGLMLIDTGAQISVISHAECMRMGLEIRACHGLFVRLADGRHCGARGKTRLKIGLAHVAHSVDAVVLDAAPYSVILGMDWLSAVGVKIVIDCGESSLTVADQPTPVTLLGGTMGAHLVRAVRVKRGRRLLRKSRGTTGVRADARIPRYVLASAIVGEDPSTILEAEKTSDAEISTKMNALLEEFADLFPKNTQAPGATTRVEHTIDTGDSKPISVPMYRSAFKHRSKVNEAVKEMLKNGLIEPSRSPWSSPVVMVGKKDGGERFCVDYRRLNAVTKRDAYPATRIDDALDMLSGARWFTTMDLASGYWQLKMAPADKEKTAFITTEGLYQWKMMPMGLSGASATFQRAIDEVLAGLKWTTCLVYLDDIIVFGRTFEEHLQRLREVLLRIREAGFRLKRSKCHFAQTKINYLGHVVSAKGIQPDPEKVQAVRCFPRPTNVRGVKGFIGLSSYYRKFIPKYSERAEPLRRLEKKGVPFIWGPEQEAAFEDLRLVLSTDVILAYPDFGRPFRLETDASSYGLGAILAQEVNGDWRPVAYASRALSKAEQNYSATECECLAIVWAIEKFRPYIHGDDFTVVTDHSALRWLMTRPDITGRLGRWALKLQEYRPTIVYRKGTSNGNADALSRDPILWDDITKPTEAITEELSDEEPLQEKVADISSPNVINNIVNVAEPSPEESMPTPNPTVEPGEELLLPSTEEWNAAQLEDDYCKPLFAYFSGDDAFLETLNRLAYRRLKRQARGHIVEADQLKRKVQVGADVRLCNVVPARYMAVVLHNNHDTPMAAHMGISKTFDRLRIGYWWKTMYQDVSDYINSCSTCQRTRKLGQRTGLLQSIPVPEQPFDMIAIDLLGPFPTSANGNKYIAVCADYMTRWIEAAAIPDPSAESTIKFLMTHVVARHSVPKVLLTDRGTNFTSGLTAGIARALGIRQRLTTARRPQTDGLVERFNHTLAAMIAKFTTDHEKDWDRYLPLLLHAYRTTRQSSTGYSPFRLLYGREATLPLDVAIGPPPPVAMTPEMTRRQEEYDEYVEDLRLRLADVRERAKVMIDAAQKRQSVRYNRRRKEATYQAGDLVWVENLDMRGSKLKKIKNRMRGPFQVVDQDGPVNYRLKDMESGRIYREHADRMALLQQRDQRLAPTVALTTNALTPHEPEPQSATRNQDSTICPETKINLSAGRSILQGGAMWRCLRDRWMNGFIRLL